MPYPSSKSSFDTYREGGTRLDISLMVKMVLAVRGFRGQLDEKLRKIGQSTSRMETLGAIFNMKGPKSQSNVAKRLRVEGATVTRMVDILSKEGLVERAPDPKDRRVNLLSVTPEGERVLEEIFRVYDVTRNHFLGDISQDEMLVMHDMFDRMIGSLDRPVKADITIADMPEMDRLDDRLAGSDKEDGGGFIPNR